MAEILEKEQTRDYSLIGVESKKAVELGLAEAIWYQSPIPREKMKELLVRKDGPAIRDTLIWFGILFGSGYAFFMLWGTWWAVLPYIVYSAIYAGSADSRWHESSHGTAFKTGWMNSVLYEIASFMVFRQSITWRWSHTRHHSDTLIRGRDPEIAAPRPPDIPGIIMQHFALKSTPVEFKKIIKHAFGKIDAEVATYVPEEDFSRVFVRARIYVVIYASVIGLSIYLQTLLPLFFIGFPTLFGTWLMLLYGLTQHAGLAENVLDHRINCRTVYINRIHRFLYWNMNYHVEHHMFPLVPYHNLPRLHELMKDDCPTPYPSIWAAHKEIWPTLFKQVKDPYYHAKRELPEGAGTLEDNTAQKNVTSYAGEAKEVNLGWIKVCAADSLDNRDVIRYDLEENTFAIYKTESGQLYATEGICTHGSTHLAEGLVIGDQIECPKHNGRFSVVDGSVKRPPVCQALKTYAIKEEDGQVFVKVDKAESSPELESLEFEVVTNKNVATYIKELTLKPLKEGFTYQPGDYIQLEIPAYVGSLKHVEVPDKFLHTWRSEHIFDFRVDNLSKTKRNYSMATNPETDDLLKFNVRLALPPIGLNCSVGVGSAYVFGLKPGDIVRAVGPFGDFRIKESNKEMVYIGGGAGMAPLRSHISNLLDAAKSQRKISYWYGARSLNEVFYQEYFEQLAASHENFNFRLGLSEPMDSDNWQGATGFIHQIAFEQYLSSHPNPGAMEFYLCGPPAMVFACKEMLAGLKVAEENILFDEF